MHEKADHTFVVLAYGEPVFLRDCIDSLMAQNLPSHVCIATSTPLPSILKIALDYNIEVHIAPSNQGVTSDWNFGLRAAQTRYVTLAHDDDFYHPSYTSACIRAASSFSDTLMTFSDYSEILDGKRRSNTLMLLIKKLIITTFFLFKNNLLSRFWKKMLFAFGSPISAPSVMFNKDHCPDDLFSQDFKIAFDWEAWTKLARMKGRFVYLNKQLMSHRIHTQSLTTQGIHDNLRKQEDLLMFRKFWPGWIAHALSKVYSLSYNFNSTSGEK